MNSWPPPRSTGAPQACRTELDREKCAYIFFWGAMTYARVFQSGNSQAVRLPKEFRLRRQPVAPQAHGGVFANVEPLAAMQQLSKRSQIAVQLHAAKQAAELHFLLLAL